MNEYQNKAKKFAQYPKGYIYPVLGLAGEAGEVVEKFKKLFRSQIQPSENDKIEISKELGDVLWYVATICTELGLSLQDVADKNIEKLESRLERGVINGKGDNR